MNPFVRSIVKHAPVYFSASIFGGVIGMVMTKYYTHVFTPERFGVLTLYLMFYQYLQTLVAFTVDQAAQRVYYDFGGEARPDFFGTVLLFMAGSSLGWLGLSYFLRDFFVGQFGGDTALYYVTVLAAILFVFVNFLNRVCYNEFLSRTVFRQKAIQAVAGHAASVAFIAGAGLGILGRQLGELVSLALNLFFYARTLRRMAVLRIRLVMKRAILARLAFFSKPVFLTCLLTATFTWLDGILLNHYHGSAAVGIFALGFMIGKVLSVAIESASLALYPSLMKNLADDYAGNIVSLRRMDRQFCLALVGVGAASVVFRDLIIRLVSNSSYAGAAAVIPFIVFAYVMGGAYKISAQLLTYHDVVWVFPWLTVAAYGGATALKFILIPRHHELGAAYTFFCGPFFYSLGIHLFACRYFHRPREVLASYGAVFAGVTLLYARLIGAW